MPPRDPIVHTDRILVVDDERNIRLTLSRVFEGMGFAVHTARNGPEALGIVNRERVDLALVDLMLPGMDGLTLLRRIRVHAPQVPVVVFTAHGSAEVAAEAIKLGAVDFVRKPFTPREIRALVRKIMDPSSDEPAVAGARDPLAEAGTPYRIVVPIVREEDVPGPLRLAAAFTHPHELGEVVVVHAIEVPMQTPLNAIAESENECTQRQAELLEVTRMHARELSIELRTRGITSHDAGRALVDVIREERADGVVVARARRSDRTAASMAASAIKRAPCEVTLVKGDASEMHDVVALVGEGVHAAAAVRRAYDCAQSAGVATLTLLNVQTPHESTAVPEKSGLRLVHQAAKQAQVPPNKYRTRILVSRNVREVLLNALEEYDTVCVGASRNTALTQALFGSIPETLLESTSATVAVVQAPQPTSRTIVDVIAHWIPGEA